MELLITIIGLPLLFVGYKIGIGKMLYRNRWYKSILFWWIRLASLGGISATLSERNYLIALGLFLVVGFMWANVLDAIYLKIMAIKKSITEPFKPKTSEEINDEKIENLEDEIEQTSNDIATKNKIEDLEAQLEHLKNPPTPEPEIFEEIKEPEPTPEPRKDPIVEKNKEELGSVLKKLGF
jgi:hypothetical protein